MLSKINRAVFLFIFNFFFYKLFNKVPYRPLPLAIVLMRVLYDGIK
jgi:hypothetical protein